MKHNLEKVKVAFNSGHGEILLDYFNQRVKIINFTGRAEDMLEALFEYVKTKDIDKVFFISPYNNLENFLSLGFLKEATIDGFFRGDAGYYLSKYLSGNRMESESVLKEDEIILVSLDNTNKLPDQALEDGFTIRDAVSADAEEMANLYQTVFKSYPTPMNDPSYIIKSMGKGTYYKIIIYKDNIIGAASADLDKDNLNAEITDCATLPEYRGRGIMTILISELEKLLASKEIITSYTIARAISLGMNIVFAKLGYNYTGRLINNCHIGGQFEDMNVWVKKV